MFDLILAPQNIPFAVAISLMIVIGLLEGLSAVLGASISGYLNDLLPDEFSGLDIEGPDIDGADVDGDFDLDGGDALPSAFTRVLGWLHVGRVPVLILFVLFLTFFGLSGFILQGIVESVTGTFLPSLIASAPAFAVAIVSVRVIGSGLARVIPKDETSAVSPDSFVGRIAEIMRGTAKKGMAAEGRLKDEYGQLHYVMVEPDNDEDTFNLGDKVLIVKRSGSIFKVIAPPAEMLDK